MKIIVLCGSCTLYKVNYLIRFTILNQQNAHINNARNEQYKIILSC